MAMDEKGLGQRLKAARQAAGFTQQELCHQANLSFSTLTKIERGAIKSPSIFTVQSIANALNLSLDDLVGGSTASSKSLQKTQSGVSFVYFDVNGCLVHFFQRAFASLAEATGASSEAIEKVFWHYNADVCRGIMTIEDFNDKLAERLQITDVNWPEHYLKTVEPIHQMQDILRWASEHYKVGLLTNTMPGLISAMRNSDQLPNIAYDAIIDSSQVAAIKPENRIYEVAQEQAGVPASEILLIDDERANIMAAEQLGWNVLWFDDARPDESVERVRQALQPAV